MGPRLRPADAPSNFRLCASLLLTAAQPSGFPVILTVPFPKALEMLSDHKPMTRQNEVV
jgi:hypothetical protein